MLKQQQSQTHDIMKQSSYLPTSLEKEEIYVEATPLKLMLESCSLLKLFKTMISDKLET